MPTLELVFDIWEIVADLLYDEFAYTVLRNLCLACKAMVPLCRKRLFSNLILRVYDSSHARRFYELITQNPALIIYVRHLKYGVRFPVEVCVQRIFDILHRTSRLQSFDLWAEGETWDTFPMPLQILLEQLIRIPSLRKVKIDSIESVPSTIFFGCSSLTHITLVAVSFTLSDPPRIPVDPQPTPRPLYLDIQHCYKGIALLMQCANGPDGQQTVVDFTGLKKMSFYAVDSGDMLVIFQILRVAKEVKSMSISTLGPVRWVGLGSTLSASNLATLVKLRLSMAVISMDYDPLCDVFSELKQITGDNIVEEISLDVTVTKFNNEDDTQHTRRETLQPNWALFDKVMTTPGSFPMLKVITVKILWYIWDESETETYAGNLAEKQSFPRLCESRTLDFRFSEETENL